MLDCDDISKSIYILYVLAVHRGRTDIYILLPKENIGADDCYCWKLATLKSKENTTWGGQWSHYGGASPQFFF